MNSDETALTKSNLAPGSGSYRFIFFFRIPYVSEEKYSNDEPVCQKCKSQKILVDQNNWTTSRGDPEYSGRKNPANRNFRNLCIGIMANMAVFIVDAL